MAKVKKVKALTKKDVVMWLRVMAQSPRTDGWLLWQSVDNEVIQDSVVQGRDILNAAADLIPITPKKKARKR